MVHRKLSLGSLANALLDPHDFQKASKQLPLWEPSKSPTSWPSHLW